MTLKSTVPPEFLSDLHYMRDPMVSRLLEVIVGLGGEVFLLKAELERLKAALAAGGGITEAALDAAGQTTDFRDWMSREQQEFGRALLDPIARARDTKAPGGV